ncbi:F-box domain-containing protein [Mycena kentingensis (nom. inval.)]|nr:F-box domain-containing protein [Mycena kentingensis (nom. inval.)]
MSQQLPPEIVLEILEFISENDPLYKATILSITRVFPNVPANSLLFRNIVLEHADQVAQLTRRFLRPDWRDVVKYVKEFTWNAWMVDAELIVNLLDKLRSLRVLHISIGTTFEPEHLQEIFKSPRPDLLYLSLRFRPYVQKANYLPFLKGSYFDDTFTCISKWPQSGLPTISIIQDALDTSLPVPTPAPSAFSFRITTPNFAQPIVFHSLNTTLTSFAHSPLLTTCTALRLRIPSRPVAPPLTLLSSSTSALALPSLTLLDLSTCSVFGAELTDTLLARLPRLRHVILDNGALLRGEYHADDWAVFGKGCALSGVKRARERERQLKQARVAAESKPRAQAQSQAQAAAPRAARPGRKGVSTANISLRPSRDEATSSGPTVNPIAPVNLGQKIRIYPAAPSLITFATTLAPSIPASKHEEIREHFARGWDEGLAQLVQLRSRLYQSYRLGSVTVMRFAELDDEPLGGLVEVDNWDDNVETLNPPVLCFAGANKDAEHEAGCAHSEGWKVWRD